MKIVVLEKIEMTQDQKSLLEKWGDVEWCENLNQQECKEKIKGANIVVVDWVDPSPFILSMKSPSLLALMSTGYAWVNHRVEAREKNILISNVPGYASEAVAEHLIGLALGAARFMTAGDRSIRAGNKEKGRLQGIELKGRTMGIVGLGLIGGRVAEIARGFDMKVITCNRHKKAVEGIIDVSLNELLSSSDVVCLSCPLNNESRNMLDKNKMSLMKKDAIIVAATWDIIVIEDLIALLKDGRIYGAGLDVAIEGGELDLPKELFGIDNLILTPHVGYNTVEAKTKQIDICLSNIEAFKNGMPQNIIN
ncbi:MAG: NAD(P)-dependent oxidoreductase [Alphaproteobacteria bacterium]|nr:NAD(P)-dependent oxidoreductase [Alphaproteobacteria bacterium]